MTEHQLTAGELCALEMMPDGEGLPYAVTTTTRCKFCGNTFEHDADMLECIQVARTYGCGCIPDEVTDMLIEKGAPRHDISSVEIGVRDRDHGTHTSLFRAVVHYADGTKAHGTFTMNAWWDYDAEKRYADSTVVHIQYVP